MYCIVIYLILFLNNIVKENEIIFRNTSFRIMGILGLSKLVADVAATAIKGYTFLPLSILTSTLKSIFIQIDIHKEEKIK